MNDDGEEDQSRQLDSSPPLVSSNPAHGVSRQEEHGATASAAINGTTAARAEREGALPGQTQRVPSAMTTTPLAEGRTQTSFAASTSARLTELRKGVSCQE